MVENWLLFKGIWNLSKKDLDAMLSVLLVGPFLVSFAVGSCQLSASCQPASQRTSSSTTTPTSTQHNIRANPSCRSIFVSQPEKCCTDRF